MSDWYCNLAGEISGPFTLEELVFLRDRAKLKPNDLVRNGLTGDWIAAQNVEKLFPSRKAAAKTSPIAQISQRRPSKTDGQPLKAVAAAVPSHVSTIRSDSAAVVHPTLSAITSTTVPSRRPPPLNGREGSERRKQVLMGAGIGAGIVVLILLLLLLLLSFGGSGGTGGGSGGGTGSGYGKGKGSGAGGGTGDGSSEGDGRGAPGDASQPIASAGSKAVDETDSRSQVPNSNHKFREDPIETDPAANALLALEQDDTIEQPKASGGQSGRLGGGSNGGGGGGSDGSAFFGVESKGRKVIYIVDCSGSMSGLPFQKACQELSESIARLKPNQSFYVFFFDDLAYPMLGNERQMLKATRTNVKNVQVWISQFHGGGGTNPRDALMDSLALKPDVIYLLTDGIFDAGVVGEVRQRNERKVVINTIGFMNRSGEPLLQQIAKENRGDYRFVP